MHDRVMTAILLRLPACRCRPRALWAAAAALWALGWLLPAGAAETPPAAPRLNLERPIGWLGITIQEVGEELAERLAARFGPAAGTGVVVVEPMPGGPAAAAGLRRDDVIVTLDGQPIWDVRQLQRRVRAAPLGAPLKVVVLRERERVELPVRVGPMPEEAKAAVLGEAFGFGVRARGPAAGAGSARGPIWEGQVIITAVDPQSPARAAGLRPMDVVLEVDAQPVADLKGLYSALRTAAGKPTFPFAVDREGTRLVLTLAPGSALPSR